MAMGTVVRMILITALGAVLIAIAQHYWPDFEAWVREDRVARGRIVIAVLTLFTSGPLLGMGVYCWRAAATKGALLRFVAVFAGGSGLLLAFLLWRFLFLLEQGPHPTF
jgi:hypothetical protein